MTGSAATKKKGGSKPAGGAGAPAAPSQPLAHGAKKTGNKRPRDENGAHAFSNPPYHPGSLKETNLESQLPVTKTTTRRIMRIMLDHIGAPRMQVKEETVVLTSKAVELFLLSVAKGAFSMCDQMTEEESKAANAAAAGSSQGGGTAKSKKAAKTTPITFQITYGNLSDLTRKDDQACKKYAFLHEVLPHPMT
jgi:histone H3/H4